MCGFNHSGFSHGPIRTYSSGPSNRPKAWTSPTRTVSIPPTPFSEKICVLIAIFRRSRAMTQPSREPLHPVIIVAALFEKQHDAETAMVGVLHMQPADACRLQFLQDRVQVVWVHLHFQTLWTAALTRPSSAQESAH